jgi:hypothetical protein
MKKYISMSKSTKQTAEKKSRSEQSWKSLTDIISNAVSRSSLTPTQTKNIMTAINESKSQLSSFLTETGRKKREKDPNAPVRPRTSYILFCSEQRPVLKEANPTLSATEITSELGRQWKALAPANRVKYDKSAAEDKERYNAEMKNYIPPEGIVVSKRAKKPKDPNAPKRALSAYMFFCNDRRAQVKEENPSMNGPQVVTELGRLWRELSDEDKVPYNAKHEEDKQRYEAEKAAGSNVPPVESSSRTAKKQPEKPKTQPILPTRTTAKPAGKAAGTGAVLAPTPVASSVQKKASPPPAKGKAPAKSAVQKESAGFSLFSEEQLDDIETEHPDWNEKQTKAELNKRWKELTEDDRQAYEDDAEHAATK